MDSYFYTFLTCIFNDGQNPSLNLYKVGLCISAWEDGDIIGNEVGFKLGCLMMMLVYQVL